MNKLEQLSKTELSTKVETSFEKFNLDLDNFLECMEKSLPIAKDGVVGVYSDVMKVIYKQSFGDYKYRYIKLMGQCEIFSSILESKEEIKKMNSKLYRVMCVKDDLEKAIFNES